MNADNLTRAVLCLLIWSATCTYPQAAHPQQRDITVFITDALPFGYRNSDGAVEGMGEDMTRALARTTGLSLKTVLVPVTAVESSLANTERALAYAYPMAQFPQALRIGEVAATEYVMLLNAAASQTTDPKRLRLGAVDGFPMVPDLRNQTNIAYLTPTALQQAFEAEEIDAIIGIKSLLTLALRDFMQYSRSHTLMHNLDPQTVYLLAHPEGFTTAEISALRQGMALLVDSGMVAEYRDWYFRRQSK